MELVVLKFGGTSLTTIEKKERILEIINETIERNEIPIVVVSAIGRMNDPYATDTLLSFISEKGFKENNLQATDLLMSCGEIISCVSMASFLFSNGINAIPLTGGQAGIITDHNFGNANVISFDDTFIKNVLKDKKIPIVAGFQGITKDGLVTTLGRGGSDTTATIIGKYLNAKRIEIYKDVDGIMTCDPKEDNRAEVISYLSYEDAFDIANNGARVIHDKAISFAKDASIPIHVKNLYGNKTGTIIRKRV